MPSKGRNIHTDMQQNSLRQCSASGCVSPRSRISPHCVQHTTRRNRYGHPLGRMITRKEYEVEHTEVSTFIAANLNHPAVTAALKWIEQWLVGSFNGDRTMPAHHDMARLHNQCVTPVAILTVAAALWVYSQRRPARLPDDLRLTYAMSLAVLGLIPREQRRVPAQVGKPSHSYPKQHSALARRDIGGRLRRSLVALFVNINEGLNRQEEQRREQAAALRVPFGDHGGMALADN